jgi:peptidoglycan/LPS O-acetylase OafA/YrhL
MTGMAKTDMNESKPALARAKTESVGRISELDVLRFTAAMAVLIYHFTFRPVIHGVLREDAFGWFSEMTRYGYMGVNLFFMISGFVIIWTSEKRSARDFVISRIARLYPSFWVCVLITAALVICFDHAAVLSLQTVAWNLTMAPGPLGKPFVDGVYWTLFVEAKFYFLIFLLIVTHNMARIEKWLWAWLIVSAVCASRYPPHWLDSLVMYPYGIYFISGAFFYLVRQRGMTVSRGVALAISCGLGALYAIEQRFEFANPSGSESVMPVVGLIVFFHGLFLAIVLRPGLLPNSKIWFWLGCLTYPLYLLHNRIGKLLWSHLPTEFSDWTSLLITTGIVLMMAWLVAAIVERRVCKAFALWLTARADGLAYKFLGTEPSK